MIRRFRAMGYRNLAVDGVTLGRINLLVGPNGSGKSNFIQAMRFFSDMLADKGRRDHQNRLVETVERHGRTRMVDVRPHVDKVSLSWELGNKDEATCAYSLDLAVGEEDEFPAGVRIHREKLETFAHPEPRFGHCQLTAHAGDPGGGVLATPGAEPLVLPTPLSSRHFIFDQLRTLLSDPIADDLLDGWVAEFDRARGNALGRMFSYPCADFVRERIAKAVDSKIVKVLDAKGLDLANVLRHFEQSSGGDGLRSYTDWMTELIPDINRIWTQDANGSPRWVRLQIGGHEFRLSEMSHGTIMAMVLAALLAGPRYASVVAVDEPELNLHPAWLKTISSWFLRSRSADQFFVSTHSPDMLDSFTAAFRAREARLLVFSSPDGTVRGVEPDELAPFFGDGWELGDLYRVGEPTLGGWPW